MPRPQIGLSRKMLMICFIGSPVERQYTNSSTFASTADAAAGSTVYETVVLRVSSVTPSSPSQDTAATVSEASPTGSTALNGSSPYWPSRTTATDGQVLVYITRTELHTYPHLHTTFTDTVTYLDDARTHHPPNGVECAYGDFNCPVYTISRDSMQIALKSADDAACLKSNGFTKTRGFGGAPAECCGGWCGIHFMKVDVFYFPPENASSSCKPDPYRTPSTTSAATLAARDERHHLSPRFHSLGSGSTAVVNGYTLLVIPAIAP